jgi:hypothetical protein
VAHTILIVGFGSTAGYLLDMLARMPRLESHHIVVATRSADEATARVNTTRVSAGLMDFYPRISVRHIDLDDIDATAALLAELRPEVIAYTARFMKGLKYGQFSYPNGIGYGAWIPLAVVLIHQLMQAVSRAGIETQVINSSFPDGVCPALASIGLAPLTGAGNLNHLVPRIRMAVAGTRGVPPHDVDVVMLGSHFLNTYVSREGSAKGSPYYLSCTVQGQPLEGMSDAELFAAARIPMSSGPVRNLMIASDMARIVQSLVGDEGAFMHLPGPNGLPGGYPARVYRDRIEIVTPAGMTLDRCVDLNARSLAFDGIAGIDNGDIHFTDEVIDKMASVFGLRYPRSLAVADCRSFARRIELALAGRAA